MHDRRYNRRDFLTTGALGLAAFGLAPTIAGCFGSDGGGTSSGNTQAEDIKQFETLQAQLDIHRTEFLDKKTTTIVAIENWLFYLRFTTFDPTFYSYNKATNEKVKYDFSIGSGDDYNFQANPQVIASAEPTGSSVIYHAWKPGVANQELGQLTVDAPNDEQKWWSYNVFGGDVYIMKTVPNHTLYKWTPGNSEMTPVVTLEDAGVTPGIFFEFGIEGTTLMFVESGRLWELDLATNKAVWVNRDKKQVSGVVYFGTNGIFYTSAGGPHYLENASSDLVDLKAAISANAYKMNPTFANAHHYSQNMTRFNKIGVYVATSGLFAYDVIKDVVWPILLNPRDPDLRIDYRRPTVMDDGTIYVTGLQSTSGAVGAEGPVYTIPASAWLR